MENKTTFRNHYCKLIKDNISIAAYFVIATALAGYGIIVKKDVGLEFYLACILGIVMIVVFFISFKEWRKTFIHIEDSVLVYEKLTLNKTKVTISLKNISNVNVSRNLFEAIFGTRTVKLDINSSAITETDISMCLKKADAELMEELITKYKDDDASMEEMVVSEDLDGQSGKSVDGNEEKNISNIDVIDNDVNVYGLKKSEKSGATIGNVISHCFYSMHFIPMIAISILFGIGSVFTAEEEILTFTKVGLDVGIVTVILMVIASLVSFLKQFFVYYDFKSYREKNTINISYGLLNKQTFRIPVNKINAISISTSILGRICGRMHAQVKCVGVGDDEKEMSIITLSISKKEMHERLLNLLPEFVPQEMKSDLKIEKNELNREPKATKILYLIYAVLFMMMSVIIGYVATSFVEEKYFVVVAIAVCVVNVYFIIYTIGKYYTCGYLFLDEHAVLCEGVFAKKITIISHKTIEGIEISSGPIMKKLGICSGNIKIKASILDSVTSMCHIDVKHKDALIQGYLSKCRKSKV